MRVAGSHLKQQIVQELEKLPQDKWEEVLDFVLFLRKRSAQIPLVPSVPASHLDPLVGMVAWGGDALAESEGLYDDGH
ncbi:MAG: hypothetical protein D6759_16500 [Chloroflexi bacterium]|nr:MAG: hypothetical protein D6759_16500 [Chloroflexota bacterium]